VEHIKLDYFYIETDGEKSATLYALEKVDTSSGLDMPPRLFRFWSEDSLGENMPLNIEEVNYR